MRSSSSLRRGRAFARAALAGNPSDGYGGRTLAVVVREFAARAEVRPAAADRLDIPLVRAAVARFRADVLAVGPVAVDWATTVPREVGLAGSSAIVIAVLRALARATGATLGERELARMALAVEAEDLGIAAGLQDRLVQAHEGLAAMDFGGGEGAKGFGRGRGGGPPARPRASAAALPGLARGRRRTLGHGPFRAARAL